MKYPTLLVFTLLSCSSLFAQQATLTESEQWMGTYAFGDPNPVPKPDNLYYPYFRFDGFSDKKVDRKWKTVNLENEYIRVTLFPEIGGKIWGAVDKTSGKEFIYYNHVVKFRDIAMRGPWVSGGIEYNFGIIGHAPTSATPVDYLTRTKPDGSVSCYISAIDLITRTTWMVEVNVPKDKAYFTTHTTWFNSSPVDQPYYQWMNAGYKAAGEVQFCYPGNHYIGHGGELHSFPKDEEGRDISWYKNNAFGGSKSYHILGYYNDFYGAYWHQDDFGSVHHADYDQKLGMKIFLWSQARDGAIWEDLLTDTDGQYVELQSGRMYNQPATNSSRTPFKHMAFQPGATDEWTEYWYPVKGTKGMVKGGRIGALNVIRENDSLKLYFSPSGELSETIRLYADEKEVFSALLQAKALQTWTKSLPLTGQLAKGKLKVVIGNQQLVYSESEVDQLITRPKELPEDFDWNSVYGLYTRGEQWMNQKIYGKAETDLKAALTKDPYFAPAVVRLASLYYRQGRYEESLDLCRRALSLDAYDGEANYVYGLCNIRLDRYTDAKDGFSVASYVPAFRTAAYAKLAAVYMRESNWKKAIWYADKSLQYNTGNLEALQELLVCYRKSGEGAKAIALQKQLADQFPLNHIVRYEGGLLQPKVHAETDFSSLIRNELPEETYMELAGWYVSVGCEDEAIGLLSFVPDYPIACYERAWLLQKKGEVAAALDLLERADGLSPEQVFPFRPENLEALQWASSKSTSWKPVYYQAMIWHANGDKSKALDLLHTCTGPAYIPFYLYRASLRQGEERLADLKQAEALGNNWRTGLELIKYAIDQEDWESANETAFRYYRKYPDNYVIGLQYAKTLCETHRYDRCISLLKKIRVLPNEGAHAGRVVYRNAHLYKAMEQIKAHQYGKALRSVADSKVWEENLGVGKPYEDQIDYRLENYLEAKALPDHPEKAALLLQQVANVRKNVVSFESTDLLTVLALREAGNIQQADKQVAEWKARYPNNPLVQWCTAIYQGDTTQAAGLLQARTKHDETTPWESTRVDYNFDLIVRYFTE